MSFSCVLHVDMDSFFATVEQQANPQLRGRPIAVSGKEGSRSVIVASSKEAKIFGVQTGQLHYQARKICPSLIFVQPDILKYKYLHGKLIDILKNISLELEVFSIDEAFLDLTTIVNSFSEAEKLAKKIKKLISQEMGEWITCRIKYWKRTDS